MHGIAKNYIVDLKHSNTQDACCYVPLCEMHPPAGIANISKSLLAYLGHLHVLCRASTI